MTDTDRPPEAPTIRATRIEVVDTAGRPRVVIGDLGRGGAGEERYGVALLGGDGRRRLWVVLDDTGPALVVDQADNVAVQLGVDDDVPDAIHVGAYLHLADAQGSPVVTWRVDDDGSLNVRTRGRRG